MDKQVPPEHLPDQPLALHRLHRLIARTRLLLRFQWLATGMALAAGFGIFVLVLTSLADLFTPFGFVERVAAWLLIILPATWLLLSVAIVPLLRRRSDLDIARRIEERLPNIQDRLVSCLDLEGRSHHGGTAHHPFYIRLLGETVERIGQVRARQMIDLGGLRRAALLAVMAMLVFHVTWLCLPDQFITAMTRILNPLADIPPASWVRLEVRKPTANALVLRGDDIVFSADVKRGEVDELELELQGTSARQTARYPLRSHGAGHWELSVSPDSIGPGFEQGFQYRLRGGGTWTKLERVTIVDRPAIADLTAVLHLPEYLGIREPVVSRRGATEIRGPEGSLVDLIVRPEGQVARGHVEFLDADHRPAKNLDLAPGAGETWSASFRLQGQGYYRVVLENELRYANRPMPAVRYLGFADAPPEIRILRPGIDLTMGSLRPVPIAISAVDDLGLASVWLFAQREGGPWQSRILRSYAEPRLGDDVAAVLDLGSLSPAMGQLIRYRAEARDRKGQVGRSKEYVIHMTADQGAAERQLAELEKRYRALETLFNVLKSRQSGIAGALNLIGTPLPAPADQKGKQSPAPRPELPVDLRHNLGWLADPQMKNAELSEDLADELAKAAQQVARSPLLPSQLAEGYANLEKKFGELGQKAIRELAAMIGKGAKNPLAPAVARRLKEQSQKLKSDLDDLQQQLSAIGQTQEELRAQSRQTASQDMREAPAPTSAESKKLEQLRKQLGLLRQQLRHQQELQESLRQTTRAATTSQLSKAVQDQSQLDQQQESLLKSQPFQSAPKSIQSSEQNPPNAQASASAGGKPAGATSSDAVAQSQSASSADKDEARRRLLLAHQAERLGKLTAAERSLASNEKRLDESLNRLRQDMPAGQSAGASRSSASKSTGHKSSPGPTSSEASTGAHPGGSQQVGGPIRFAVGESGGSAIGNPNLDAQLGRLDPRARAALLRLQPQIREELLQSIREKTPEGYERLVEDYFERLTEAKDRK
jgi:hypothetical protein